MAFKFNDLRSASGSILTTEELSQTVQGNTLRPFSRARTLYLFLRFPLDVAANKRWLKEKIASGSLKVTRASEQQVASPNDVLVNFFLTASGLQRLGFNPRTIPGFDPAFLRGSRAEATRRKLSDPPVEEWQAEYRKPFDALWLIACSETQLEEIRENAVAACTAAQVSAFVEEGNVLGPDGAPVSGWQPGGPRFEPFGYRDGVSQVVLTETHEKELGSTPQNWDPRRNQSVVFARDPLAAAGHCSYFVLRKLEQDVPAFRARVTQMAEALKTQGPRLSAVYGARMDAKYGYFAPVKGAPISLSTPAIEAYVRGQIMGRMPDGTPLANSAAQGGPSQNDFNYAGDDGARCPFSSHARSANPRGSTGSLEDEAKRTIVRSGTSYGRADEQRDPRKGCGLLFLCAQSNIENQFEFIQAHYLNKTEQDLSLEPTPMRDNLGASRAVKETYDVPASAKRSVRNDLSLRYEQLTHTMEFDFHVYDLIMLKGAEYLYAPSIAGLDALGASTETRS